MLPLIIAARKRLKEYAAIGRRIFAAELIFGAVYVLFWIFSGLSPWRLRASGWSFAHPVATPEVFVDVSAETAAGETALLYAGPVLVPEAAVAEPSRRAPTSRESLAARAWSWVRGR